MWYSLGVLGRAGVQIASTSPPRLHTIPLKMILWITLAP